MKGSVRQIYLALGTTGALAEAVDPFEQQAAVASPYTQDIRFIVLKVWLRRDLNELPLHIQDLRFFWREGGATSTRLLR